MKSETQPGIAGTVRGRLIRGFGATALGPVVTAIIQLGTVPLLLHAWGAAKYGDWLLLSAVPSYLVLSDMGFGTASGSDMTMRVAAGDREGALRTFQSSWALLASASIVMMLLATKPEVMGTFVIRPRLRILGWAATGVMAIAVVAMFLFAA